MVVQGEGEFVAADTSPVEGGLLPISFLGVVLWKAAIYCPSPQTKA